MATTSDGLPALTWPPVSLPRAAADQIDVQAYEAGLLDLARVHHPTVTWWHGYRKAEERYGSYCYVCERFVVSWDRFLPIPDDARSIIDNHKVSHRNGNLPGGPTKSRKAQRR